MTYLVIFGDSDPLRVANKDDVIATLVLELSILREQRVCVRWPDGWMECRG